MKHKTPNAETILKTYQELYRRMRVDPTIRIIAEELGLEAENHTSTIQSRLKQLVRSKKLAYLRPGTTKGRYVPPDNATAARWLSEAK